ncbi:EPPK1 isoform 1 [Pongo abelii]|uniref:Epiplakin n=1 Tax=Pongo abelii TaxID=9601 RepID=A0A2J8RHH4_PONAB|nr:EPPK1 isoform 1 [Pongo abelii]
MRAERARGDTADRAASWQDRGGRQQALHNQLCVMSGHTLPPLPVPGANSTEQASVPKAMAATLGARTPPRPQARSIAGVYVEASGQAQSVYTAMEQGLLPAGLGLALLEAQAATGGLVDPAQGQLLPVSKALQQGLVGLELKEKLLAAERATTGYPDPYGGEKLALFQAIGKEVVDRALGQSWLEVQLATGGLVDPAQGVLVAPEPACHQGLLNRETWHKLSELEPGTGVLRFLDPNTLERLTYYQLLERCVRAPGSGLALLPIKITFRSMGGAVSAAELLEVGILDEEAVQGLREGRLAAVDVSARAEVRRYLEGTGSVAGVVLLPEGHKKSFFQAATEHLLPMGTALPLLEAQAATHTLVDPITGQRLWVDEAVRAGLVSPELHEQLLVAEQAVTGHHDPFSGSQIPLFQAMKKGLVDRPLALRLLDAQLATGGLVCPARRLRLPLEAALRCGCLDEDTRRQLLQAGGFSDGTHGGLRYEQLLALCVTDPETGLAFLPLSGGPRGGEPQGPPFIKYSTQQALSTATATVSMGKFQGRPVSLWELLFSEVISSEQRAMLAQQYQEGTLSVEKLAAELSATLEQAAATARVTFSGLRNTVTPGELLKAEIIDQDLYERLEHGQATAQDVGSLASVQRYLQGTGCIAGLLLPGSQERLSIYEARCKGLLRPGTALILLEAQAATGFIIDPKANKRHSVEEALRAAVIGPDVFAKLLSAERAVTGYTDPYTGQQISLFQAMQKGLIVREHGIRLLEAQIATGGVIDPVHSHRVPVDVAYRRGYFDQMLNLILLDPSDDTKGFFDPNTHENLTYLQLLERCVRDPETGLYLLPLSSTQSPLVDSATRQAFQNLLLSVKYGRFQGQRVSAWELINSEYFSEGRRRQLLHRYRWREVTLGQVAKLLEAETQRQADIMLPALRSRVTVHQLLEAGIIDQQLLDQVLAGTVSPEALLLMDGVRRYLCGLGAVGGVRLLPSGQRLSLYQAMRQKLLGPRVALALLEAQAATGTIMDPHSPESLSVDEAVRRGVVGPELYGRLKRAEGAIAGFRDPFSGKQVSLFQAMKKGLIPWEQAARLLEAQVATGGVIDPTSHHHLPMPVAIQRGCVDQEMETALSSSSEAFPTPDGQGRTSYAQLLEQCPRDEASGLHLLPLPESAPALPTEEQVQKSLQAMPGAEDGTSLWDLLSSCHFTEDQRRGLLEDVQEGRTTVPQLLASVQRWVQETKLLAQARVMVPGPRGEVPAVWLLDAGIITQETLEALAQGTQSPAQVAEQPVVKACLWGTGCVAGVLLQPSGAKASIAQAMRDGLLPTGLGQRLLEAQVASGFLVDPLNNQRLSVEDAVKVGLVGRELSEQLGQAERAVDGYPDPYSGGSLSLWQAMEKGLVPQNEGLPLLQVQLATGGVVDPVHGVHLPQAAAFRLGLLDTQTSQVLTAVDKDNKFFFDPSARDQVTYQQLRERCVCDSETGLLLLPLPSDTALEVDDHTAVALRAMKGQSVSVWELLFYREVSEDRRQELLSRYRAGTLTVEELGATLTSLLAQDQAEAGSPRPDPREALRAATMEVKVGRLRGRAVPVWDVLASGYVSGAAREELLAEFGSGTLALPALTRRLTAMIEEAEEAPGARPQLQDASRGPREPGPAGRGDGDSGRSQAEGEGEAEAEEAAAAAARRQEQTLRGATMEVQRGQFQGRPVSVWDVLFSSYLSEARRDELLARHAAGALGLPDLVAVLTRLIEETEERLSKVSFRGLRRQVSASELHTSGILGPETLRDLAQGTKTLQEVTEMDSVKRYLEGTSCIAGVLVPAKDEPGRQEKMSIYQAMWKGVLRPGTALVLLEAQAATGFVVDPVRNLRLSVEEAVAAGVVGGEIQEKLLSAERAVTGYTDPYTGQQISLFQAMQKDLIVREHGIRLLEAQIATGGVIDPVHSHRVPVDVAYRRGYFDEEMNRVLADPSDDTKGFFDPNTHENLTYVQLLRRCVRDPDTGLYMLQLAGRGSAVHQLSEELRCALRDARVTPGSGALQGQSVSVWELLFYREVSEDRRQELLSRYRAGTLTVEELGATLTSLLAQDQAEAGSPRPDPREALRAATMEVKVGRLRGRAVPVWDVLASGYVSGAAREELLAEFGSGTLALPALTRRLTAMIEEAEEAPGARPQLQDASRGPREPGPAGRGDGDSGRSQAEGEGEAEAEEAAAAAARRQEQTLRGATMEVQRGQFQGRPVSVWDVLFSSYLSEARRDELLARHAAGALGLPDLVAVLTRLIEETEERLSKVSFRGLRRQVSASELHTSGILGPETLRDLAQGTKTLQEVTEMDSVKRYLEGTSCIAGVLVPAKDEPGRQEKMSIYQAMWKGVLRPGTALVLLEAQAATGFVVDPVRNLRLSVEEAVAAGVVGGEIQEKLLSAERAVTGYTDPYTGQQISLFQAMQKDLIVREHGIRLLEAQIATGGVIDPVHSHRVPVDVAYRRGYFDEEMNRVLADPSDDTKGFFDPNTHENLTYVQLLRRCVRDPDTGLYMLQLAGRGSAVHQLSEELRCALRDARVTPGSGALQGQSVSVWELLFYREVSEDRRQELLSRYRAGTLTVEELGATLTSLLAQDQAEAGSPRPDPREALRAATMEVKRGQFQGRPVSVWDVLFSSYLSEARRDELLARHAAGALGLPDLVAVLTRLIEETEERLSKVSFRGLRRQVSASELHTSGILGPETLRDLAQGTKTLQEVTEMDSVKRYLEGTSCIAGVLVPAKDEPGRQEKMSIYQAMWKGVLRPGTALVLLEAQAATGFVVDPVRNLRLSVEEAVAAGVVGGEIQEKLLSAERAVTGYTDPYTGQQISLFQAMQKDLIVREHGIRLLEAQIATGGVIDPVHSHRVPVDVAYRRGYFDEEMNRVLADPSDDTKGFFDPNTHENLTYVQLLRRCVRDPDTGLYMLQLAGRGSAVHQLSEELRCALRDARVTPGSGALQGQSVSVWELLFYREVSEDRRQELLSRYRAGTLTVEELGATLTSLLAQDQAEAGSPRPDPREALRAATMEVKVGRLRGRAVPVWDVLASGYVSGAAREELLAEFGSGTLALPALTRRLTAMIEEAEEAPGARPQLQDASRGPREPGPAGRGDGDSGRSQAEGEGEAEAEEAAAAAARRQEQTLRGATMEVQRGQFQGRPVSVWDVLFSSYLSEARRDELLARHAAGALGLPDLVAVLTRLIEETEERLSKVSFRGLRRQVSASELHTSGILGPETLRDLAQGTKTLQEVTEMDSVKRYLEGTSCIAGVLVPAKDEPGRQEKMSIYQAMWKGVLRPGTALVLLEAQAATGFVVDPVRNLRLSVEEAVAAGVVGGEIQEKLLSAERAVTGYTDPYTGQQISLFQAMQKDLIVREHGIRLLEAQIATGGVIDPVHSHRVPVDVAYRRGYFDEEMNRVLADPSDDTKGFFDPNTHENLTYVQLLRRCVRDPDTGLYMLQLAGRGSAVHQLSEELRCALRDARVTPGSGALQGQSVSVWELLFYREVSEDRRQELLSRYRAGTLTVEELGATLTSLLAQDQAEAGSPRPDPREALRAATMEVKVGRLRGRAVPVWDVLASGYVSGAAREELLAEFGSGTLALPALTRRLTAMIEEAEEAPGARPQLQDASRGPREPGPAGRGDGDSGRSQAEGEGEAEAEAEEAAAAAARRQEQTLRGATMEVQRGQFQGRPVSVWDVLFSSYLSEARRDELLARHAAGALGLPDLVAVLTRVIEETEERLSKVSFRGLRRQVSASELHTSGILGPETLRDLAQGTKTLQEVTEMDSVKRYLEGTSCIAGVLVPAKDEPGRQEKMSIYQAMWKGVLRPGTALVLLEAQAATGFVVDPVRNLRLSVEEAVAAGVVGGEIQEKLLSAERAVTGYTDPYTGQQISLFQAMQKDLIVREHGIRLLEAQIATGGVIDPVHSHRVPVDVAYRRGYFDEEMNRVLADPSDDTKGFFDPNTHENLTYLQLLQRATLDPETGLLFLTLSPQ